MNVNGQSEASNFDLLTEILKTSPLAIRFAGRLNMTAPCRIEAPEGVGAVFCVGQGQSFLATGQGHDLVAANPGDMLLLSPMVGHRIQNGMNGIAVPVKQLLRALPPEEHAISVPGAGEPSSILIGGFFEFGGIGVSPLCWMLPPTLHVRRQDMEDAGAIESLVCMIAQESSREKPGQSGILNRLLEVLFIRTLQSRITEIDPVPEETIHGLLHRDLATTLALIHREPGRSWTVASLADEAAMSRSNFSATFLKVLGKPPLQYVRDYRMQLARRLLRNPALGLKEIASRIGYDSPSAFSAAFKRETGMHPSGYRRHDAEHK
ncbi:MAG: AraC family transcriptional regulator [Pirellulales bacterium]|nr:AraC family transcriptional regulator [Pirellulales bacterium]